MKTDCTMWDGDETHPTLTCCNAGGGQRMPDIGNFNGIMEMQELEMQNVTGPMEAKDGRGVHSQMADEGKLIPIPDKSAPAQYRYAVRRITPVEGERLQGFADNWTRPCFAPEDLTDELVDRFVEIHRQWAAINGKPDHKPKSRAVVRAWLEKISSPDCPDGPRYKAIGNSMSVNVMAWIGERIDDADRTLSDELTEELETEGWTK